MENPLLSEEETVSDPLTLIAEIDKRDDQISALSTENDHLKKQLDWLKHQLFGKRSERVVSDTNLDQMEFEGFSDLKVAEEKSSFRL